MVTASGDVVDRVVGLEVGADDYVAKPFEPRELLASVKSVLRRMQARPQENAQPVNRPGIPGLQTLRGWSHEYIKEVFPGSPRARGPAGL
jgi:PleD family two-component response regulator